MHTIAEISPSAWRYSIILLLWAGSTRENSLALEHANFCSDVAKSSNSLPENDKPSKINCMSILVHTNRRIWKSLFASELIKAFKCESAILFK